jgi:DNA gyrase subunit A
MDIVVPDSKLLVISKRGFGKLTDLKRYRSQGRGGLGIKTFNITRKTGPVAAADVIDDSKEVYVVSEQAQVLRTSLSEIRSTGRATQGVTIFKPEPGDAVASIACCGEITVGAGQETAAPRTNGKGNGRVPPDALR